MSDRRRPPVALVGAGRLARAFLPGMVAAGYPLMAVAARTATSARRLARRWPGARAASSPGRAVKGATLVLLAVPDGEIGAVADGLAASVGDWKRRTVLHHAGVLGVEPLARLAGAGAGVGVLHPLQVLGSLRTTSGLLPGCGARIEGDRRGEAAARRLAHDLGLVPLRLKRPLTSSDRAAYHAAASLASNDLVALLSYGVEIFRGLGLGEESALSALAALARGALVQAEGGGIEAALTGPIARGDADTVAAQIRGLARSSRTAAEVHRLLSLRLADLAAHSGRLSPLQRRVVKRRLR